jgi:hypothetical protein
MENLEALLDEMIADPRHGWSIGTFGAIGEFARDEGEPAAIETSGGIRQIVTARGGMRVSVDPALQVIAYDTLSSDGETWGQSIAFCLPAPADMEQNIVRTLGADGDALTAEDGGAALFDLGVGLGHVCFCVRTRDAGLIDALGALEGKPLFGKGGAEAMVHVLRAQPHRIMLSPAGRVEVYSPIPQPGGSSPEGPHTHLMPKLLAARRTHAANAPIPAGLQPVLMLHPRSPWRDGMGQRVDFDTSLDNLFLALMARFGLANDHAVRIAIEQAVATNVAPEAFPWPDSRRGRAEARITLRRLARTARADTISAWRRHYDRVAEPEPDEDAAVHA